MDSSDLVSSSGYPQSAARSPQILVVDDEPALRRFTSRVLAEVGYSIFEAGDGAEALELVRAKADHLDVVVSDIVMPRLTGVQLMQELSLSHPQLPIVLMSGYGTTALNDRGIAAPCAILRKPFSAEHLLDEVRRCLRDRSAAT